MLSLRLLALLALSSLSSCAPQPSKAPRATIEAGVVIGAATSVSGAASATAVNKYLGVPFAASPTRFSPPASATAFTKPFNATRYGLTCPQQFNYPAAARAAQIEFFDTPGPPNGEGEDCLNVNIFVPVTETKNKTVMVWIFGVGGSARFWSTILNRPCREASHSVPMHCQPMTARASQQTRMSFW